MILGMRGGRWYGISALAFLMTAGGVAWLYLPRTSAGPFDPASAVIALTGLAVSITTLWLGVLTQRQADMDVTVVAGRLAVAVRQAESEARRQLLGGYDQAIDVQFSFRPAPAHDIAGAARRGSLQGVVPYYRKLRLRRLVITGAAGSGKTVLAVELILGLLDERSADDPVPVRMSAALLDVGLPSSTAMQDWLAGHLRQTYGLSRTAAEQLVAARKVLPVVDGLDEMDAADQPGFSSRVGQAIRACNAYLDGSQKGEMVLTCRIDQYGALEQASEWVRNAAHVQLRPVDVTAAREFLTRRVADESRWRPVLDAMRRPRNSVLASALSTPWRLAVAATVYEARDPISGKYARDPADLVKPQLATEEQIRDHLLSLLIPVAVQAHGGRHPAYRVHQWLGVLATYLDANTPTLSRPARVINGRSLSGTDLVLHELWAVAGPRAPRAITAGLIAVIGLGFTAWQIIRGPLSFTHPAGIGAGYLSTFGLLASAAVAGAVAYAWTAWPRVTAISFRRLKRQHRQHLMLVLGGWLAAGLAFGLAFGLLDGLGLGFGLAAGFALGAAGGLWFWLQIYDDYAITGPRETVRNGLAVGLAVGLAGGLGVGLGAGRTLWLSDRLGYGLAGGIAYGLTFGLTVWLAVGLVGWRYIALLCISRRWNARWLPFLLGSFLKWCYDAGLIRVAGIAYQFRHRELQDYLARNPIQ